MRNLSPEQLDAADVGRSGIVSAGAGSGKTTVLVAYYLRLLHVGVEPRRIVVMTFMRKAAAELRERIDSLVAEALREGVLEDNPLTEEERRRLFEARSRLTDGHIGTIHSFCRRVLVEEPVLMPERPDFAELDSAEALRLRERAENAAAWASEPLHSPLARLLEAGVPRRDLRRITHNLLSKRWELARVRAVVERGFEAMRGVISDALETVLDDFGQRVEELWRFTGRLLQDTAAVEYLRGKAGWPRSEELGPDSDALATLHRVFGCLAPLFEGGIDEPTETLKGLLWLSDFKTGASKCKALRDRNPFIEIRHLATEALPETLYLLERERQGFELARMLLRWMSRVIQTYDELKVRGNATDYDDLLNKVLEGLREDRALVRRLRKRYHHFLVDEFQDTDPRQWEIIRALALPRDDEARRGSRTLFIVGDRKQAIFGFRGGDNTVFLRAEKELRTVPGFFSLLLKDNYRSRRRVLDFVNPFFTSLFSADGGLLKSRPEFSTAVEPQWMEEKRTDGEGGSVTLVNTYALTSGVKSGAEALEALVTAGVIADILQGGVDDFPQPEPYRQSDGWAGPVVGVMARKGKQLMLLAAALDAQGLAGSYSVARGSGVFASEEAQWLRSILSAIADRRDEVSLAAAMLSPLVGLSYE
ncbi:UvrD-helicase domain-containing protein, partial [bacterium]|nr:UvrD-helicase domain-containing protein [bacterium]